MSDITPSETPNVVVANPSIRKGANIVLGTVGILVGAAIVADVSSPAFDISALTTPVTAVYGFLAGVFGLAVTVPNIPKA